MAGILGFLSSYDGTSGTPFVASGGPSSRDEEGKKGLFLSCGGTLGVPLECRRGRRRTSSVELRVSRTLSRLKKEGGLSLEMTQQKKASSHVEGRISCFNSSCGRKLWFHLELQWGPLGPLVLPQENPVSMRVARGLLGFLSSLCWVLGPHL